MDTITVRKYLQSRPISEAEFDALTLDARKRGERPVHHEVGRFGSWVSYQHPCGAGFVVMSTERDDLRGDDTTCFVSHDPVWGGPGGR